MKSNELIKEIGLTIVNSIPINHDWELANYSTYIIVTYSQSIAKAIDRNKTETSLSVKFRDGNGKLVHPNLIWQLREAMYNDTPEKGAWYSMEMTINRDGKFKLNFDYDNKPVFNIPIDDIDFIKDDEKYPRTDEFKPEWLKSILTRKS